MGGQQCEGTTKKGKQCHRWLTTGTKCKDHDETRAEEMKEIRRKAAEKRSARRRSKTTMEEVKECPICYDKLTAKTRVKTNCGHSFCESCLRNWRLHKNTCPCCRAVITKVEGLSRERPEEPEHRNIAPWRGVQGLGRLDEAIYRMEVREDLIVYYRV